MSDSSDDDVFNTLRKAIKQQRRVRIQYRPVNEEKGLVGERVVEPHAMGRSKKGKHYVLRAWVRNNFSYRGLGSRNRWRLFRVDHIETAELLDDRFGVRVALNPGDRYGFNPDDKQMDHLPRRITVKGLSTQPQAALRRSLRNVVPQTRTRLQAQRN
jgi:predicted DNA-binding transcriptional regulator YafY